MTIVEWGSFGSLALYLFFAEILVLAFIAKLFNL
jgi:hypothetical protein